MTFDGRQRLMEEDFDGRRPLMEDNLRLKTTFDGRQPSTWKTTLVGRLPLMEDNLERKTVSDGRQPSTEDSL